MPITQNSKRRILYIKKETTAGTYITSTTLFAVANAVIPPDSLKFTPDVSMFDRKPDGPSLQPLKAVTGQAAGKIAFSSRLIGPSAKGIAGPLSDLFKAAAMSETLVGATSATFVEDPNSQTRLSVGFGSIQEDGLLEVEYSIAGAAVSKMDIKAGKVGEPFMVDWELHGKLAYESGSLVAIDDASPNTGITFVNDDAQGFKFLGLTVTTGIFTRSINNFVFTRGLPVELGVDGSDLSGYDYCKFGQTDPQLKIDPSKVAVATSNDLGILVAGTVASAGFTVTNAAGAKFSMAFPNLQIGGLSDDARGAVSTWGVTAHARRSETGSAVDASDAFSMVFA
jgi:hypothetical protein